MHLAKTLSAMVIASSLCTGCATFAHGPREDVHVVTNPPGATIFVNGRPAEMTTPTTISVPRRRALTLRLARAGYTPEEVALRRRPSKWLWLTLGICANPMARQGLESPARWPLVVIACFSTLASVDLISGAAFAVQKNVSVDLQPAAAVTDAEPPTVLGSPR